MICREGIFILVINKELSQEPSRPLEAIDQCIHLGLRISLDQHSINSRTKKKICLSALFKAREQHRMNSAREYIYASYQICPPDLYEAACHFQPRVLLQT